MKLLPLAALLALSCVQIESHGILGNSSIPYGFPNIKKNPCEGDHMLLFKDALNDFSIRLTKRTYFYSADHFIISPYSIWLTLASLAELTDPSIQKRILRELNSPEEYCIRDKLYELALDFETPGPGVRFDNNRARAIERANINRGLVELFQSQNVLVKGVRVPFIISSFEDMYEVMGVFSKPAISGHSILLDRIEFEGMRTTAFADGNTVQAPFYNDLGEELAKVEYLKMKSPVRLARLPYVDARFLELPVGTQGWYTLLLIMGAKLISI